MENLDNSVNIENNSKLNLIKTEIINKNYARRDFMNVFYSGKIMVTI